MKPTTRQMHQAINGRGQREQEQGYLFPCLYPSREKALTRRERGAWSQFEREFKKKVQAEKRIQFRIL
jgi:hypothetical protein